MTASSSSSPRPWTVPGRPASRRPPGPRPGRRPQVPQPPPRSVAPALLTWT
nr:MAG TPA: hypothetical protein [Caudoviricetes sp.]